VPDLNPIKQEQGALLVSYSLVRFSGFETCSPEPVKNELQAALQLPHVSFRTEDSERGYGRHPTPKQKGRCGRLQRPQRPWLS
jgi:hypothetical protein